MATLTTNLFWGQGERNHRLTVAEGHWPEDMDGAVFVVGPDKRRPGGHWFGEQGLLEKIHLRPAADGRIEIEHRRIATPVDRLRRRWPRLFTKLAFMEVSPFGITNLANTNVEPIAGRLFVGYDAGRPVEVDPSTLEFLTPVGANDEWLQAAPGLVEPLCAVAAHPGADHDENTLYFVNYNQVAPPGVAAETYVARWRLDGPVERWRVTGMSPFDSIHDVKVTEHHIVFSDLPFQVDPGTFRGLPPQQRNQDHTTLWILAKADLASTPMGGEVAAVEVRLPMPTGHLLVDHEEVDGLLRVVLQHAPIADLVTAMTAATLDHRNGQPIDANYEGLPALALQPSVVGRYLIDPATGEVVDADVATDVDRVWGGILATTDTYHPAARARHRQLWYAGAGFDPDLVPEHWWQLYRDAEDAVVAPADLPATAMPGTLARIDLEAMKVAEVWSYADGAFPSPPTFVPRAGADDPDDGYIVVVVHRNGPKELQVFDAGHIEAGPLARATAPGFNPSLLLHSCWMPDRDGPRRSDYRVPIRRDIRGAIEGLPDVMRGLAAMGKAMAGAARNEGPR